MAVAPFIDESLQAFTTKTNTRILEKLDNKSIKEESFEESYMSAETLKLPFRSTKPITLNNLLSGKNNTSS